ncbi:GGDEF and EAL domain-containing protein [Neorhizobium lilium]|uniref:GGDEF and EAL domain-containing protein n=1 Tax=Neorhizobium lilium TaxID=2503024 RepID=A0A444LH20_9HYPH|nr:EAL domain-containing protein [Neorhizobium lilium]RWX78318.1 GGDEF and EAL domain-containing protein [Neorhizobium lilium]
MKSDSKTSKRHTASVDRGFPGRPADRLKPTKDIHDEPSLAERYLWLEAMINHVPDFIYAKDLEGRFLFANHAVVHNNGMASVNEIIGRTDAELHGSAAASAIDDVERRVMVSGQADLGLEERAMKAGWDKWLMMSRVPLRSADGTIIGVVGASRDITARKASEMLMAAQAELLRLVVDSAPLPQFIDRFALLLEGIAPGLQAAVFLARGRHEPMFSLHYPDYSDNKRIAIGDLSSTSDTFESIARETFGMRDKIRRLDIRSSDGELHGLLAVSIPGDSINPAIQDFLNGAAHMAGIAIDRIHSESRIRFLAEHDALTGLPSRIKLDEELKTILRHAGETGGSVAVSFIDVDNFKLVNDSLGHEAGDELLKEVAAGLSIHIGHHGLVSRIGGDEFVVVLNGDGVVSLEDRMDSLRKSIRRYYNIKGIELQVTSSMGIAIFPDHGTSTSELLAHADLAMYRAKLDGRDGSYTFNKELAEASSQKLLRIEDLRRALLQDEIILHYQPQKNLKTGALTGVEALVRWQHPKEGLIAPAQFVPLAEETGLILDLGLAVLVKACRQAKAWQDEGLVPVRMSVNMSTRQFQEPGLPKLVAAVLEETGLDPRWLEIEITESLIMKNVEAAVTRMGELTQLGLSLALDDFGTGYSSLSMLKRFPLTRLKIDRSFISEIPEDEDSMAIVSAVISLGQKLGLVVLAEGVETQAQADYLRQAGCEEVQGYLEGRPMPAAELRRTLP